VRKLPAFQGTAGDLGGANRNTVLDRARSNLRHAFTPARPISKPGMFAGRTTVLRTLIQSIEDQQLHVVIYGERGIGKTSLLHILDEIARDARYIVRYSSCGEDVEFSEFFRAIMRDIPLLYHSDFAPTSEDIEKGGSLADLLPDGQVTVADVSDVFAKLSSTRVLLLLDEFDRAHAPSFRRSIAELIKNLSDRSVRVQLVISGVASNLTELIEHIPSIRRNILGLQVPNMTDAEIHELISNGEAVCGLKYDAAALDAITVVAHGSPYIASLICQLAGIQALDRNVSAIEYADVIEAVNRAYGELEQRVSPRSRFSVGKAQSAGLSARLGLLARAALHTGGRFELSQVEAIVGEGATGHAFISSLISDYGLLQRATDVPGEVYQFVEEGVAVYLWMGFATRYLSNNANHTAHHDTPSELLQILDKASTRREKGSLPR